MESSDLIKRLVSLKNSIQQTIMMNTFMLNPQYMYYQLNIIQQELNAIINAQCNQSQEIEEAYEQEQKQEMNTPNIYQLLLSPVLYEKFSSKLDVSKINENKKLVAMSIDIRKSTFYLENCIDTKYFVKLLEEINASIISIVEKYFGIINKFNGDGFIVFFPEFYSGKNFILLSLLCAKDIIESVKAIFNSNEEYYYKFPMLPGIGIGLDIGSADLLKVNQDVTYIGRCVVNACRICCHSTNEILINTMMKTEINKNDQIEVDECMSKGISYKDNPEIKVYSISISNKFEEVLSPEWSLSETGCL